MRSRKKKYRKAEKTTLTVALLIAAILLVIGTGLVAKYLINVRSGGKLATAQKMIFVADMEENTADTAYVCAKKIEFELYNYDGMNTSDVDISFQVAITGEGSEDAVIKIGGDETDEDTIVSSDGVKRQKDIEISNLPIGLYEVTVTATPYKQAITLYYQVGIDHTNGSYKVTAYDTYTVLDIYTGTDDSDITVTYTGYAPDTANDYMATWTTAEGSGTLENVVTNGHYSLVFFGTGTFSVKQSGTNYSLITP